MNNQTINQSGLTIDIKDPVENGLRALEDLELNKELVKHDDVSTDQSSSQSYPKVKYKSVYAMICSKLSKICKMRVKRVYSNVWFIKYKLMN